MSSPEVGAGHRFALLLVTRNLPPLVGGMERLNFHVVKELAKGFRISVVGPEGCARALGVGASVAEVPIRPLWSFLLLAMWRALTVIRRDAPNFFFSGSGLTAPITWLAARITRGRCVVYLHGLDMIAPSAVYRCLWLPLIRRHDLCIVNSQYSRSLALAAGLREAAIRVLNPGVDLPSSIPQLPSCMKQEWGMEDCNVLLYVGRLTPRKGLLQFIEHVLPGLIQVDPRVRLVVIGEEATDAIHIAAKGYLSQVKSAADRLAVSGEVRFVGSCSDQVLSAAYAAADALIFPVIELPGDVEGFGMVAIEAAAHGTPTVAFSVGGIPDAVRHGVSGALVNPADYAGFAQAIHQVTAEYREAEARVRCRKFAEEFQWESFGMRLRRMIKELPASSPRAMATH